MTETIAALAALAAVFAPAALTGSDPIDMVQRGVIAGAVTFVGAHGRRASWLVAGALVALPASGASMVLALVGLSVAVASTLRTRRSRRLGAVVVACYVNAIFWFPPHELPWGVLAAVVAVTILIASGSSWMRPAKRRALRYAAAGVAGFAVVACALVAVAAVLAGANVRSGGDAARAALDAARDGDGEQASTLLHQAGTDFDQASGLLDGPLGIPARFVPGVAQQLGAVRTTVAQGRRVTDAGDDLVATADYDRLQYHGRLDLDLVEQLAAPTERADVALSSAATELDRVRDGVLLPPLRSGIDDLREEIVDARRDTEVARSLVSTLPQLFGRRSERHYLVIFLTPAELRGAGGFIGSFAELKASDGKVDLVRSGRIDDLLAAAPAGTRTIAGPKDYLARYGRFRPQDFLQDVTFSPNFPSSAQVIAGLYPQSGGTAVDGVIGVDPTGLAALLQLTGPVEVDGLAEPLSADNAVDLLTRRQYVELGTRAERGEILANATQATFERLVHASLPSPRSLAGALSPAARGGHLRLWSPVDEEQAVFEQLGADGTLSIPKGDDGFSVVQRNVGNNKIDAYLHREIDYRATIDAHTGKLTGTLRITLTNDVPQDVELPPSVVDNTRAAPEGTNVAAVSIHTRNLVTRATLDGRPILLGPGSERGMHAWDTPDLAIGPGETRVLEVHLTGALDLRHGYDLRILPQPVANPDQISAHLEIVGGLDATTGRSTLDVVPAGPLASTIHRHVALRR